MAGKVRPGLPRPMQQTNSHFTVRPANRPAVTVWHDSVELRSVPEDQRQKVPISLPQRQLRHSRHLDPDERSVAVFLPHFARKSVDAKDKPEPVLSTLAEARPGDGPAQLQSLALQTALLANLTADAGDDVLVVLQFPAQSVV